MLNIKILKENRKKLKLNQVELSGIGMSREYISDIERGKSILNVSKAKVLINKMLFFSMSKEISIDLRLTDYEIKSLEIESVLEIYSTYFTILSNKKISSESFEKLLKYSKMPFGDYLFFVNKAIYIIYRSKNCSELAYNYLNNALDIAFISKFDIKYFSLYENIKLFRSLAFQLYRADDIIVYYQKVLTLIEKNKIEIKPFTYYNLALFEKMSGLYKDSLNHLNLELELNRNISQDDLVDLLIMKAGLYFKLDKYDMGIDIYQQILLEDFDLHSKHKQTMVASNLIYFIVYYGLHQYDDIADKMEVFLLDELKLNPSLFDQRYRVFGNLGQYYCYKGMLNESLDFFLRAFEIYHSNYNEINMEYFNLLSESFNTFKKTENMSLFLNRFSEIDYDLLNDKLKVLYLKNLTKILYHYSNQENNQLEVIINKLGL